MGGAEDLSDDEFLLLATSPVDNLKKQRKRGGGKRGELTVETMPDDDLDAIILAAAPPRAAGSTGNPAPATPPYTLTDYASENKAGPVTDAVQRAQRGDEDLTGTSRSVATQNAADIANNAPMRSLHGSPEDEARGFKDFALGQLLGMGGTKLLGTGKVGQAVSGGAGGAVQAAAGGGDPRDILLATLLGTGAGAAFGARGHGPRAPRTQAEMDAVALQEADPRANGPILNRMATSAGRAVAGEVDPLPAGQHGTNQLAREADQVLDARVAARRGDAGQALDAAEAEQTLRTQGQRFLTHRDISDIQRIRDQAMGPQGPYDPRADARLENVQAQLTQPGGTQAVSFPQLRAHQLELNRVAQSPHATPADERAAAIVARAARDTDDRLGPGNFPGALDRWGAEKDALSTIESLRGPEGGRVAKLARAGTADASDGPQAIESENQIRQLQQAEPAANDLIAQIRARGVKGRRGLQMPSYMGGSPTMGAARAIRQNLGNLNFKLNRPQVDAGGMVSQAPQNGIGAMPLELQLLLMQRMYNSPEEQQP